MADSIARRTNGSKPLLWPRSFVPWPKDSSIQEKQAWFDKVEHRNFTPWDKFTTNDTKPWDDLVTAVVHIWEFTPAELAALRADAAEETWPEGKALNKTPDEADKTRFANALANNILLSTSASWKSYVPAQQWTTHCCQKMAGYQLNRWKKAINRSKSRNKDIVASKARVDKGKGKAEDASGVLDSTAMDIDVCHASEDLPGGNAKHRDNQYSTGSSTARSMRGRESSEGRKRRKGADGEKARVDFTIEANGDRRKVPLPLRLLVDRGVLIHVTEEVVALKGGAAHIVVGISALRKEEYLLVNTQVVRAQHLSWELLKQAVQIHGYNLNEAGVVLTYIGSQLRNGEYIEEQVLHEDHFQFAIAWLDHGYGLRKDNEHLEFRLVLPRE